LNGELLGGVDRVHRTVRLARAVAEASLREGGRIVNVLLAAEESVGVKALALARERGHRVVAVLSAGDPAAAARTEGIPVWRPELVADPALAERIREDQVELLLNVHSLHIADPDVIAAPRIGSFNLHPGLLPEYAGLNVPSWAILAGERLHGLTLHWMGPRVDEGPIAYQERFEIRRNDTGLSLSAACAHRGLKLLQHLLADAAADPTRIPKIPQDLTRRRYFGREVPYAGRLPWGERARTIVDLVRASDYGPFPSPWGRPKAWIEGEELEVLRTASTGVAAAEPAGTVGERAEGGVRVAAADEWVLVQRVRHAGKGADPGSLLSPGDRFEMEVAPLGG
jgi:methionyl-tRNA formyltransferase